MSVILSVLLQQVDQTSFLWQLRAGAVEAQHYSLADLAKLDQRLEAHLDGLRIADEEGWQLWRKELAWEEPGEVFAAAVLAFEQGNKERIAEVIQVGGTEAALTGGLISALGWLSYEQAEPHINDLLTARTTPLQRIGIAAAAIHREDPARRLGEAASDPDPLLKARALRAVGELGRLELLPILLDNLNTEDDECRFSAAWSSTLLSGGETAVHILQSIAESGQPRAEPALQLAVRRMDLSSAHTWRTRLAGGPKSMRSAVIAAGAIGDSVLVPWLISLMSDPALARVAGEAFSAITGVDIAYADLDGEKPEGFDAGPTEDPEDENVEMDADENLPWPDRVAVENWCDKQGSGFTPSVQHLLGKPITADWLQQVLRIGRQRHRAAAAMELALRSPGLPLFNIKSPGFRQQYLLGIGR
jgi:uncharacterized protein (TIGR02270 family)